MNPIISIIIPCYNHGKYIEETLASIEKAKDCYPVEIIIVNDGSTDEFTVSVLKRIEEKGYFVLNQTNGGLGNARNNGIRLAKGKYILPLDSDNNVLFPYLNDAVDILEKNEDIDIVYGDALYIGKQNGLWKNKKIDKKEMLFKNHIDACAIFRKSTWKEVNLYAEDMPYMGNEDWNFWLKCLSYNKGFYYLGKPCFEYRVLDNSMIRTIKDDFLEKNFRYNINYCSEYYKNKLIEDYRLNKSIFYGGLLRKLMKMTLNHFKIYKYKCK